MSQTNRSLSNANSNLLGPTIHLNQTLIQYFMNSQNIVINHAGYIDKVKMNSNTRLLALNPNKCRLLDSEKMHMLI